MKSIPKEQSDDKLDFASAILTLIIAAEDNPPAFSRLNDTLQIQIIAGVRTLIEDAQAAADTAYNQTVAIKRQSQGGAS